MAHDYCLICKEREATKTNSHIIPSFLVAMFTSADGSGKRDTEVMFTISNKKATTVYTGRSIPTNKREELFDADSLTDERIKDELENNTASRDFVFCPTCEKRLADYLESPYGSHVKEGKKVDGDVAYFFWLSIVWRMSIVGGFGIELPNDIETALGNFLNNYLQAKSEKADTADIIEEAPFRYKLIHCKDYCKEKSGFQNATFNSETVDLMVGDFLLRASFDKTKDIPNPPYYGAEELFADATVNNGNDEECMKETTIEEFSKIVNSFVAEAAALKKKQYDKILDSLWTKAGQDGVMPDNLKKEFYENYLDEDTKMGDRHTIHNFAVSFRKVLVDNGYIKNDK